MGSNFFRKTLVLLLLAFPCGLSAQFLYWDYVNIATDSVQSGAYSDMVIDGAGTIHVSYWNRVEDKLIYAWRAQGSNVWSREYIDTQSGNGFRSSIDLDATGQVHIAYYQNVNSKVGVRFAKRLAANNWQIETIPDLYNRGYGDYGPLGPSNAKERIQPTIEMIFDENNIPQIVFFDAYMQINAFPACTGGSDYGFKLHQAFQVNNQWVVKSFGHVSDMRLSCGDGLLPGDTLPQGDRYGEYLDLLLRPDGSMEVYSMSRFNNELIQHRTLFPFVDTVWVETPIDSMERLLPGWGGLDRFLTFEGISATVSADDRVHLSYCSSIFYGENFCCTDLTNDLVYARLDQGGVFYHSFGVSTNRNYTSVLTHGGSDSIFIAYADLSTQYFILQESADSGNTWQADTLTKGIGIGKVQAEIHGDSIYVLLFDAGLEKLVLWTRSVNGGVWASQNVTTSESRGQSMDALWQTTSSDTIIHTAYNDGYLGKLYHATGSLAGNWNWTISELDPSAENVIAVSIANTAAGEPAIAYAGGQTNDLRLAIRSGASWNYIIVDSSAKPQFTDVQISNSDSIYIAYYEGNQECLYMATGHVNSANWRISTIMCDTSLVGLYPSLVLDANGLPQISYYNDNNRSLYYGKLNNTTWSWDIDSIAGGTSSAVGKFNVLKLDPAGLPNIAYLDEQNDEVWLAEQAVSGTWSFTLVDSAGVTNMGRPIDMDYDQFGKLWMSYNYYSNFEKVKLLHRDGPIWREVGVSSAGRISNAFKFKILGGDMYIVGKKNEIQNSGMAMLRAVNGVFVEAESPKLLSNNISVSNYPNPFSGTTTFRLELSEASSVGLQVFNMMGQKVATVIEGRMLKSGVHEFDFDGNLLPNGIYLYQIQSKKGTATQKMTISR